MAAVGTAASIGYDVKKGKPVGKSVISGVGGALEWGYDQLPQGVQNGIESGFKAAGDAVSDAGKAIGEGASDLWNSIF